MSGPQGLRARTGPLVLLVPQGPLGTQAAPARRDKTAPPETQELPGPLGHKETLGLTGRQGIRASQGRRGSPGI